MSKSKDSYPEIENIKEDLDSLKGNVVGLSKHVQEDGVEQIGEIKEVAKKRLSLFKKRGEQEAKKIEKQVKANPIQSVAIAFAGGIIASALLRGRK